MSESSDAPRRCEDPLCNTEGPHLKAHLGSGKVLCEVPLEYTDLTPEAREIIWNLVRERLRRDRVRQN